MVDPEIVDHPRIRIFTNSVAMAHVSAEFFDYFLGVDLKSKKMKHSIQKRLQEMAQWVEHVFLLEMRESLERGEKLVYEFREFGDEEELLTLTYNTAEMSDDDFMDHYRDIIHPGIMAVLDDEDMLKRLAEIILESGEA